MVANLAASSRPRSTSLITRLTEHARTRPLDEAITSPDVVITYEQLSQLVEMQAGRFAQTGITTDSVIGIECADDIQHLILCLAAIRKGATSVTIPTFEGPRMRETVIKRCEISHVVDDTMAVDLDSYGKDIDDASSGEAKLLFMTSGTTGEPKIVVHTDAGLVAQAHRHVESEKERFACLATIEHNFAKRHRLFSIAVGATNVFPDNNHNTLVDQCKQLHVNVLHVSAFQAQELLEVNGIEALTGLRLKLGGSHVNQTLREELRSRITPSFQAGYGTTESGAIAFTDPDDKDAGESVGRSLPGLDIRVISPKGEALGPGKQGELLIRCDGMFREYLNNPEQTGKRLIDGWFHTGDIGYLDEAERIYVSGRADDMFVFNSLNIYPQDIEAEICEFPDVVDAAVLPKESATHGKIPVAIIVFSNKDGIQLSELQQFVRDRVGIRSPRQYIPVNEIPRNASGKILRHEALALTNQDEDTRKFLIQAVGAQRKVRIEASELTAFEKGESDIKMRQIKLSSLGRLELLVALEVNYDIILTHKELNGFSSLGEIAEYIQSHQAERKQVHDISAHESASAAIEPDLPRPYAIRLFQRIFRYCPTVAHLNRALIKLGFRYTPTELKSLADWHSMNRLLPPTTAHRFHDALSEWIDMLTAQMLDSDKQEPEVFTRKRIAPAVTHYVGSGSPENKKLLICFSPGGALGMAMPCSVLLQNTNASHYDVLVFKEPTRKGYRQGSPLIGGTITEVIDWLANLNLVKHYSGIRTIGCSAGAVPTVLAAYRLNAELAVSVGGRFHKPRMPNAIFERFMTVWKAVRKGRCSRLLLCYGSDRTRDLNYARAVAWISGGSRVSIEFDDELVGHHVFIKLVDRGELGAFFRQTIFAEEGHPLISAHRTNVTMKFPDKQTSSVRLSDNVTDSKG